MTRSNTPPARRTWVHVSTLLQWDRPPVGIVRAEQEYCRWLRDQPPTAIGEIRYCRFDRDSGRFVEVAPNTVADRLQALASGGNAGTTPPQRRAIFKTVLLRALPHRLLHALVSLRRHARLFLSKRLSRLRRFGMIGIATPQPPQQAAFHVGDCWVSLGLDWDTLDQRALYEAKLRYGLQITLMCYDVIPALFPQLVVLPPGNFAAYITDAAWCADRFICISEHTRQDLETLLKHLGAPVPNTHVVHLGSEVASDQPSRPPRTFGSRTDQRPFVLFVSTIERRKNHEVLYRAWVRLREQGIAPYRLVFVGMRGWGVTDLMQDLHLDPRVQGDIVLLDRVDDAELAWLYQHCAFTVFPSLYEGWGLPLVESLAWGKFCLASQAASLPEAGGPWAEYLDPWDLPAWVERLAYYMSHPDAVAAHEAHIRREFQAPRWADAAVAIHRLVLQPTDSGVTFL